MGKVVTKAWLRNNQDLTRLADGRIAAEQVRQQEQELIDTAIGLAAHNVGVQSLGASGEPRLVPVGGVNRLKLLDDFRGDDFVCVLLCHVDLQIVSAVLRPSVND